MKTKHIKQHLICWKYSNAGADTFHMQHYDTKGIAMDKRSQLLEDRSHIHPTDILYRCVVFKFKVPNREVQPAATEPAEQAGRGPLGCEELLGADHQPEGK